MRGKAKEAETRVCRDCGQEKPLITHYYKLSKGQGYDTSCRKCRIAKQKKQKADSKNEHKRKKADNARLRIYFDFTNHEELLNRLESLAEFKFRTLNMQVLWMLTNALEKE